MTNPARNPITIHQLPDEDIFAGLARAHAHAIEVYPKQVEYICRPPRPVESITINLADLVPPEPRRQQHRISIQIGRRELAAAYYPNDLMAAQLRTAGIPIVWPPVLAAAHPLPITFEVEWGTLVRADYEACVSFTWTAP